MGTSFKSIALHNWRQFRDVSVELHPHLTILTGANGAGKTTLLNLLSRHFGGWHGTLVSTPRRQKEQYGQLYYSPDFWDFSFLEALQRFLREQAEHAEALSNELPEPSRAEPGQPQEIGNITYSDGRVAALRLPMKVGSTFQIEISGQQNVKGLHIPSHRPLYSYQQVENIPTVPRRRDQLFGMYADIVRSRYYGGHHARTPNYFIKETLIALATFGYGNEVVEADHESLVAFEQFQEILRIVLPPSLGFLKIAIRIPEVVLLTKSGDFSIDAVSGGVASLIDIAWQIFTFSPVDDRSFVVTIDEPENHLHPELQRTILGSLVEAFPEVQFICATHNPFIVSSVPDSSVYVLRYDETHRVYSEMLSDVDRAGTSNEILRDVLGLDSTSPLWVERKLKEIESILANRDIDSSTLGELRQMLQDAGLEKYVPESLASLAQRRREE